MTASETATPSATILYEPYGQPTVIGKSYPFLYTGRTSVDRGTLLLSRQVLQHQTGRFISEDPIGLGGGNVNLYRTSYNTSYILTDPVGLWRLPRLIHPSHILRHSPRFSSAYKWLAMTRARNRCRIAFHTPI